MPLVVLTIVSMVFAGIVSVGAGTGGYLALYAAPGESSATYGNSEKVHWKSDVLPGGYPNFDLDVNITDVYGLTGIVMSVEWDPTYLNCTGFTPGTFLPTGLPDATGWAGTTPDNVGGIISEAANSFMAGYGPASQPSGWGLVATLGFVFVGTAPAMGSPISSFINITMNSAGIDTLWTNASGVQDFVQLDSPHVHQCEFYYEAAMMTVVSPTASFVITTPTPIYEGTSVDFDASASTGGCDGDTSPTPITEYWWSFEGEPFAMAGATPSHTYATAGSYSACLYVVAPGVPAYIDPSYVNTSATVCKSVDIKVLAFTGIDVYTENFRWPWYTTTKNGSGPMEPADCFGPQENVDLYAYVYYNDDAVQNKLVKFVIEGPDSPWGQFVFTRTAYSSNGTVWNGTHMIPMPDGVAWVHFRIPWPCEHAESRIFGVWNVSVEVALPDVKPGEEITYKDSVWFKVSWGVEIVSLTTLDDASLPKDAFKKCETIYIEVNVTNCHMEPVDAVIAVAVYDDVGTIIGSAYAYVTVPAEDPWCTPGEASVILSMHIPKWAYVGAHGMVYANAYTWWPWDYTIDPSPVRWCPEASHGVEIVKVS